MLVRQNFDGPGVWHTRKTLQQDARKCRPARPQRVKGRGYPLGYVEGLNDARTTLADFFSILLAYGWPLRIDLVHQYTDIHLRGRIDRWC